MPAFFLTDAKCWTVANALRCAAEQYDKFATEPQAAPEIKAQFERQAAEARELAAAFEGGE